MRLFYQKQPSLKRCKVRLVVDDWWLVAGDWWWLDRRSVYFDCFSCCLRSFASTWITSDEWQVTSNKRRLFHSSLVTRHSSLMALCLIAPDSSVKTAEKIPRQILIFITRPFFRRVVADVQIFSRGEHKDYKEPSIYRIFFHQTEISCSHLVIMDLAMGNSGGVFHILENICERHSPSAAEQSSAAAANPNSVITPASIKINFVAELNFISKAFYQT